MVIQGLVKKKEKHNYLFCSVAFLLCVRCFLLLIGFSQIAALLFRAIYLLTALFSISSISRKISTRSKALTISYLIFSLFFLLCIIGIILFEYGSYFQKALTFLLVLPIFLSMDAIVIHEKDARLFLSGMTLLGILLTILIFIPSSYKDGLLLLYSQNGNQNGLLFMTVFMAVFSFQLLYKNHFSIYAVLACLIFGCWKTESRTAFFCCVFLVLIYLLLKKYHCHRQVAKISIVFFIALPFLMSLFVNLLGEEFTILNVSAWTGRETLWPKILKTLIAAPFDLRIDQIIYSKYGVELGTHNAWLEVAWNYSVPTAIIFLLSLLHISNKLLSPKKLCESAILVACFSVALFHMSFEASLLCGALDYSLYFVFTMLSGITAMKKREEDRNE